MINNSTQNRSLADEILCPIKAVDAQVDFKRRAVSSNILYK